MIRINLLPNKGTTHQESGKQLVIFFVVLMLVEVAALFYYQHEQNVLLDNAKAENAKLKKQLAEVKKRTAEVTVLEKQKAALEEQKRVLDSLIEGQSGPVRMLDELAQILTPLDDPHEKFEAQNKGWNPDWDPKRLWIDTFVEKSRVIKMTGHARNNDDLAEFLQRLNESRHFVNVNLNFSNTVEVAKLGKAKLIAFSIDALGIYGPGDVRKLANGELGTPANAQKQKQKR